MSSESRTSHILPPTVRLDETFPDRYLGNPHVVRCHYAVKRRVGHDRIR